jgi:hypothetical protein
MWGLIFVAATIVGVTAYAADTLGFEEEHYFCWVSADESVAEILGFNKDNVTVYTTNNEGLQSVKIAPDKIYPNSNVKKDAKGRYVINGKIYEDCGEGD